MSLSVEQVAQLCHEVNREYCRAIGDDSQTRWDAAPDWQRASAINGVRHRIMNPYDHPSASHMNWLQEKLADGWSYGPVKDVERKLHPCCVQFDELPPEQKSKDFLFTCVVMTLREQGMIEGVI